MYLIILKSNNVLYSETDSELLRLPEDAALVGFTPLNISPIEKIYCNRYDNLEDAQTILRVKKILFFGRKFLCDTQPTVLKKIIGHSSSHVSYKSAVFDNNLVEVSQWTFGICFCFSFIFLIFIKHLLCRVTMEICYLSKA